MAPLTPGLWEAFQTWVLWRKKQRNTALTTRRLKPPETERFAWWTLQGRRCLNRAWKKGISSACARQKTRPYGTGKTCRQQGQGNRSACYFLAGQKQGARRA